MSNESNDQREMVYKFTGKYGVTKVDSTFVTPILTDIHTAPAPL